MDANCVSLCRLFYHHAPWIIGGLMSKPLFPTCVAWHLGFIPHECLIDTQDSQHVRVGRQGDVEVSRVVDALLLADGTEAGVGERTGHPQTAQRPGMLEVVAVDDESHPRLYLGVTGNETFPH